MKYQIVKKLKTKSKTISLHDSLADAVAKVRELGGMFDCCSYFGMFPMFSDYERKDFYSIQGLTEGALQVVCSIPKKELEKFNFVG